MTTDFTANPDSLIPALQEGSSVNAGVDNYLAQFNSEGDFGYVYHLPVWGIPFPSSIDMGTGLSSQIVTCTIEDIDVTNTTVHDLEPSYTWTDGSDETTLDISNLDTDGQYIRHRVDINSGSDSLVLEDFNLLTRNSVPSGQPILSFNIKVNNAYYTKIGSFGSLNTPRIYGIVRKNEPSNSQGYINTGTLISSADIPLTTPSNLEFTVPVTGASGFTIDPVPSDFEHDGVGVSGAYRIDLYTSGNTSKDVYINIDSIDIDVNYEDGVDGEPEERRFVNSYELEQIFEWMDVTSKRHKWDTVEDSGYLWQRSTNGSGWDNFIPGASSDYNALEGYPWSFTKFWDISASNVAIMYDNMGHNFDKENRVYQQPDNSIIPTVGADHIVTRAYVNYSGIPHNNAFSGVSAHDQMINRSGVLDFGKMTWKDYQNKLGMIFNQHDIISTVSDNNLVELSGIKVATPGNSIEPIHLPSGGFDVTGSFPETLEIVEPATQHVKIGWINFKGIKKYSKGYGINDTDLGGYQNHVNKFINVPFIDSHEYDVSRLPYPNNMPFDTGVYPYYNYVDENLLGIGQTRMANFHIPPPVSDPTNTIFNSYLVYPDYINNYWPITHSGFMYSINNSDWNIHTAPSIGITNFTNLLGSPGDGIDLNKPFDVQSYVNIPVNSFTSTLNQNITDNGVEACIELGGCFSLVNSGTLRNIHGYPSGSYINIATMPEQINSRTFTGFDNADDVFYNDNSIYQRTDTNSFPMMFGHKYTHSNNNYRSMNPYNKDLKFVYGWINYSGDGFPSITNNEFGYAKANVDEYIPQSGQGGFGGEYVDLSNEHDFISHLIIQEIESGNYTELLSNTATIGFNANNGNLAQNNTNLHTIDIDEMLDKEPEGNTFFLCSFLDPLSFPEAPTAFPVGTTPFVIPAEESFTDTVYTVTPITDIFIHREVYWSGAYDIGTRIIISGIDIIEYTEGTPITRDDGGLYYRAQDLNNETMSVFTSGSYTIINPDVTTEGWPEPTASSWGYTANLHFETFEGLEQTGDNPVIGINTSHSHRDAPNQVNYLFKNDDIQTSNHRRRHILDVIQEGGAALQGAIWGGNITIGAGNQLVSTIDEMFPDTSYYTRYGDFRNWPPNVWHFFLTEAGGFNFLPIMDKTDASNWELYGIVRAFTIDGESSRGEYTVEDYEYPGAGSFGSTLRGWIHPDHDPTGATMSPNLGNISMFTCGPSIRVLGFVDEDTEWSQPVPFNSGVVCDFNDNIFTRATNGGTQDDFDIPDNVLLVGSPIIDRKDKAYFQKDRNIFEEDC